MPNYTRHGKIETPVADETFFQILKENQLSLGTEKIAFLAVLFYLGIRVSEALKLRKRDFTKQGNRLFVDVGERLKHSKTTPPLSIKLDRPFVPEICFHLETVKPNQKLFKFNRVTAWRTVRDTFNRYPHYFRLNRITNLFDKGYKINQVKSWTGLTLRALDFYVGVSDNRQIGADI